MRRVWGADSRSIYTGIGKIRLQVGVSLYAILIRKRLGFGRSASQNSSEFALRISLESKSVKMGNFACSDNSCRNHFKKNH